MNLWRYNEIKEELQNIENMLQELNTQLYKISGLRITDMPKLKNSNKNDKLADIIIKIDIEKNKFIKKYEEYYNEFIKMKNIIDSLEGIEKTIVIERYIKNKTWDEIGSDINYSRSHIFRIHKSIIAKLKDDTKWD